MKLIFCFVLFASTILPGCHSKQKTKTSIEDSVTSDTTYSPSMAQVSEERRVYDSVNIKHYLLKSLSHQFEIRLKIARFIERDTLHDSCIVKAALIEKHSKNNLDSVSITSLLLYSNYFVDPANFVSYSTGVHVFKQPVDNYAGDLIVADLNFDGRDDVALVTDMGGNGGPLYTYFIQQPDRKFMLNHYLTDSMTFFPSIINRQRKTLTTFVHAGACCVGKQIYKFNSSTQQWQQIEHVILGLNKSNTKS